MLTSAVTQRFCLFGFVYLRIVFPSAGGEYCTEVHLCMRARLVYCVLTEMVPEGGRH
jgi:hypothetical protein